MWRSIIKPALILFLICAVIAGALAQVNDLTKDTIAKRTEEAKTKARQEVLSIAKEFNEIDINSKLAGEEALFRITSYNVCYTKLLRF